MRIALYGEHGFYTTGGQAGRRGDFITSPRSVRCSAPCWRVDRRGVAPPRRARRLHHRRVRCRPGHAGPSGAGRRAAVARSLRGGRGVGAQRASIPTACVRSAALPSDGAAHRCGDRQRVARQPAVPARRVRWWLAGGVVSAGRDSASSRSTVAADPAWDWLPPRPLTGRVLPIQDQAAEWVSSRAAVCFVKERHGLRLLHDDDRRAGGATVA